MKITSIELTSEELDRIIKYLIDKFDENEESKQKVENHLTEILFCNGHDIEFESELELYIEYSDFDSNHQNEMTSRSALKFNITFFYDGEEIPVNSDKIYTDIEKYYSL